MTHYCVTRADLPPGAQAAALIHAAGESSPGHLPSGTYAVALAVSDEATLLQVEARLRAAGVPFVSVREPDRGDQLTAIGIVPRPKSQLRRYLSSYPLLRGGAA